MPQTKLRIRKDFSAMRKELTRKSKDGKPKILYKLTNERREMARACQTESPQALLSRYSDTRNYMDRIYVAVVMARSITETAERDEAIRQISRERNVGQFQTVLSHRYPYSRAGKHEVGRNFASDLDHAVQSASFTAVESERTPDQAPATSDKKGGDMGHGAIALAVLLEIFGVNDYDQPAGSALDDPSHRYERLQTVVDALIENKQVILNTARACIENGKTAELLDLMQHLEHIETSAKVLGDGCVKGMKDLLDGIEAIRTEKCKDRMSEVPA
jgi:hypothetical protein